MRTLSITRIKSFVGCAAPLQIYIEDYEAPEMTILDTPCRKLGKIKNGQTVSFEVTEQAAKVFVIADKLSKNYCNEYYPLPAGMNPVTLTGKCKYNPASGNAFRFDGVTDEAVLANRRKGNNKGLLVLLAAVAVGLVIGIVGGLARSGIFSSEAPETFEGSGYSISLTEDFDAVSYEGYVAAFEGEYAVAMISTETFASYAPLSGMTVPAYGEALRDTYEMDPDILTVTPVRTENGLCYFYYTAMVDGDEFTYCTFVSKGVDAFWTLEIATYTENMEDMESDILEWAKSFCVN